MWLQSPSWGPEAEGVPEPGAEQPSLPVTVDVPLKAPTQSPDPALPAGNKLVGDTSDSNQSIPVTSPMKTYDYLV